MQYPVVIEMILYIPLVNLSGVAMLLLVDKPKDKKALLKEDKYCFGLGKLET
jgi:hypothetical protein